MMEWIVTNSETLIAIVAGVIVLGIAVAKLTPTTADDKFWAKVSSIFNSVFPKKSA